MNNAELNIIATGYALEIHAEFTAQGDVDIHDLAHQYADGSEHVIYYSKAHDICQNCNTENGEQFLEDMGGSTELFSAGEGATYDKIATLIAYGELYARIVDAFAGVEALKSA